MTGYAIDPLAPIHKRWKDERGPIRVICEPAEGYVMARRPGAMPFVLLVADLLDGRYEPVTTMVKRKVNVRSLVAEP